MQLVTFSSYEHQSNSSRSLLSDFVYDEMHTIHLNIVKNAILNLKEGEGNRVVGTKKGQLGVMYISPTITKTLNALLLPLKKGVKLFFHSQ